MESFKKEIEILELKDYIMIKFKNSMEGFNRKLNTAKERISKWKFCVWYKNL